MCMYAQGYTYYVRICVRYTNICCTEPKIYQALLANISMYILITYFTVNSRKQLIFFLIYFLPKIYVMYLREAAKKGEGG